MKTCLLIFLFGGVISAPYAQSKHIPEEFKEGYALKGTDTIKCKVLFDSKHDHSQRAVTLLINSEEITFFAGGTITGYGLEDEGRKYDYGSVDLEVLIGPERRANILFLKKLVAGSIDLFEYSYRTVTTKRTTINGVEQPGSTSTSQSSTNYYIAKTDSAAPVLSRPVILSSFRKKDLEPYIKDNTEIMNDGEKRYNLKELIALINKYNEWYSAK
ncbi:MAG: hypothetical protein ABIT05_06990 [Chitinophagaceae bacterium]